MNIENSIDAYFTRSKVVGLLVGPLSVNLLERGGVSGSFKLLDLELPRVYGVVPPLWGCNIIPRLDQDWGERKQV